MKKFEEGGYTGDDEIVKYRMGMIDAKGNDLTKKSNPQDYKDESMGEFTTNLSEPKSVEKTVVKTKVSPSRDFDTTNTTDKSASTPKKTSLEDMRKVTSLSSMPKSFKESGGNTKTKKSIASMPSMNISLPDPLANFDSKGKRYSGRDIEDRKNGGAIKKMAKGGSVKSASSRADGCAVRGKTRA